MRRRLTMLIFFAASAVYAADFQDFQAARAVIGQSSFSARDKGIDARALSFSAGKLFAADVAGQVFTFDISQIGSSHTSACPVCLTTPETVAAQSVFEGVAAAAVNGRNVAIADKSSGRVLLWSGVSPLEQPDVVLYGFGNPTAVALDNQRLYVADVATHHVFIWNAWPSRDSQPPDVTLGVWDGSETPGPDTIQTPSALASDGVNLFVADTAAHRVLVFSPADYPAPKILNAASLLAGPLAPGTLVMVDANAKAAVLLNGAAISVTDTGNEQLQVQIPYDLSGALSGVLWTKTESEDGSVRLSRPAAVHFTPVSPGIFAFGSREPRTGLLLHSAAGIPLSPEDPAKPGELITVWATGLGGVSSEANSDGSFNTLIPVRATIGGNAVEVISAALPAEATGVYEVRLRCPTQIAAGSTLMLLQNDSKSNAVAFPVESGQP